MDDEKDDKKKSHKLLYTLLGSMTTILPAIIVILLPTLVFGFLGAVLSGFSDWASLWGSSYKLDDFTHYVDSNSGTSGEYTGDVSDETYSISVEGNSENAPVYTEDPNGDLRLMHFPDETDFVDVAIKAEMKQLSRNIYNNVPFSDAIEPFDNVYVNNLKSLAIDFRRTYIDTGIVTNSSYSELFDSNGNFNEDTIRDNLVNARYVNNKGVVGSMWTKGQILDEYLGINNNPSDTASSATTVNIRNLFKSPSAAVKGTVEGVSVNDKIADAQIGAYYLADCLSQWMYATMKVDSNRFITDAEQEEIYGTETPESTASPEPSASPKPSSTPTPVYRETCSNKVDSPLYYYTRKKVDGTSAGTEEDEQKGGLESDRTAEISDISLDMATYLANGNNNSTTLNFASKIDSSLYNITIAHNPFLSYEALNPDEVEPIEYDPSKMNNLSNTVGLGTISTIYGDLKNNYLWYTVSCNGNLANSYSDYTVPVTQKMDINTSGFYIMKKSSSTSSSTSTTYNLLYAGKNYNSDDSTNAEQYYGYKDSTSYSFTVEEDGTVDTKLLDDNSTLRKAIDTEFSKKLTELRDENTVSGKLLATENQRRQDYIDAIDAEYDQKILDREAQRDTDIANRKQKTVDAKTQYDNAQADVDQRTAAADEQYEYYERWLSCLLTATGNTQSDTIKVTEQGDSPARKLDHSSTDYISFPDYVKNDNATTTHYEWYEQIELMYLARGDGAGAETYFENSFESQYLYGDYKSRIRTTVTDSLIGCNTPTLIDSVVVINTYIKRYYPLKQKLNDAITTRDTRQKEWGELATSESNDVNDIINACTTAVNAMNQARNKKINEVKSQGYTVYFQTRVAWYLGDESVTDIPVYGNGTSYSTEFLNMLRSYSKTTVVSDVYGNIKGDVTMKYRTIDTGSPVNVTVRQENNAGKYIGSRDISINSNTAHFVISYSKNGTEVLAKMNHLICYRIMYSGMYNDGNDTIGVMHAPATANNRYNFSEARTDDGTELLYKAESRPVTNEGVLQATVDLMDDLDEAVSATPEPSGTEDPYAIVVNPTESTATSEPAVGDMKITETETLKEMLTESTWTKRDRNWRKSFYIEIPDVEWEWNTDD